MVGVDGCDFVGGCLRWGGPSRGCAAVVAAADDFEDGHCVCVRRIFVERGAGWGRGAATDDRRARVAPGIFAGREMAGFHGIVRWERGRFCDAIDGRRAETVDVASGCGPGGWVDAGWQ